MFKALQPLLSSGIALTVKLSIGNEGKVKVVVIPMTANSKEAALSMPLLLSGTADELDSGFVDAITNFHGSRLSLEQQVQATSDALGFAQREQANKAVQKSPKKVNADPSQESESNDDDDEADNHPPVTNAEPDAQAAGTDLSKLL